PAAGVPEPDLTRVLPPEHHESQGRGPLARDEPKDQGPDHPRQGRLPVFDGRHLPERAYGCRFHVAAAPTAPQNAPPARKHGRCPKSVVISATIRRSAGFSDSVEPP